MKWDDELERLSLKVVEHHGNEALAAATERAFLAVAKEGRVEVEGALEESLRSELKRILTVH